MADKNAIHGPDMADEMINRLYQFVVATNARTAFGDEGGQAMVEYALLIGFITIGAVVGLTGIGTAVANLLGRVAAGFP
jgi:Flp pilus assembly pilin Flp